MAKISYEEALKKWNDKIEKVRIRSAFAFIDNQEPFYTKLLTELERRRKLFIYAHLSNTDASYESKEIETLFELIEATI